MIDRVHFENFKSLKDVALELGRLTVLVGPNGCGKSSVLQAVHLLSQTGLRSRHPWISRLHETFSGLSHPQRLASPGRPTTMKLAMCETSGDELTVAIVVPRPDDAAGEQLEFSASVEGPGGPLRWSIPAKPGEPPEAQIPRAARFASVVYLHLDANEMIRTWIPESETPRMGFDGSGLASTLAWMKGAAEDELAQITIDLAKVVPGVKRIRTLRERVTQRHMEKIDIDGQPVWRPVDEASLGDRFEIEFDDGTAVPADLLSEGTVLALGLLTKLREPTRPRLVLLDDIDRGLHIGAQAKLVQVLRDMLALIADLQIVCTTHSPYLLDLFEPSEVRVLGLDEKRQTQARSLTEHPDFASWKFGTQTGELWASLGDSWVASNGSKPSGSSAVR